jgi:hypothetical protein
MTEERIRTAERHFQSGNDGRIEWCALLEGDQYWTDFKLVPACIWHADGTVGYPRIDDVSPLPPVYEPNEAEPLMSGYVKWDGCMNLEMDNHVCGGPDGLARLYAAMQWLLGKAHEKMCRAGLTPEWTPHEDGP